MSAQGQQQQQGFTGVPVVFPLPCVLIVLLSAEPLLSHPHTTPQQDLMPWPNQTSLEGLLLQEFFKCPNLGCFNTKALLLKLGSVHCGVQTCLCVRIENLHVALSFSVLYYYYLV